jgi:hypothetical protein
MELNADFSIRAVVHGDQVEWLASPMKGVERRMLDRIGDEVARATTIVRYAPGSHFSSHVHTGGEEFIVLDGVFQDEHGDFPVGSYIRNPPGSSHTPGSDQGCTILVKLWQFDLADREDVRIETKKEVPLPSSDRNGVAIIPLFQDDREDVRIEIWDSGSNITAPATKGMEVFVLEGEFTEQGEVFSKNSWLRLPPKHDLNAIAGLDGARVWVKSGHLTEQLNL